MNVLNEYPKALAAYSTRRLSTTYVGEPYKREVSGYISTWYDQSGNGNDAHWSFEIETNSMLCYLRHEMSQDFQDIALDMGLKTEIKFPTCVIWRGLETATIPKHEREMKDKEDLNYWKANAEEDYLHTPISVLRYITELETAVKTALNT